MTNPFDDENGTFLVLRNADGQHCLWSAFAVVPNGWQQMHPESSRAEALEYIERNWTDLRPASLIDRSAG